MNNLIEIENLIPPELAKQIYTDAASETLQEVGKIGVDAIKTIRLALFPLQFTSAYQDRLARYIDKAIRQIPEKQRISPQESLILPIAEKMRFQEEENPISSLYVNLLSRGMDKERVGEAHPAFINIISQIAPDEVLIIEQLSLYDYRVFFRMNSNKETVEKKNSDKLVDSINISDQTKALLIERSIIPEHLAQPSLFPTFLSHLVSLGLVEYDNDPKNNGELSSVSLDYPKEAFFCFKLSDFGRLFHNACVKN